MQPASVATRITNVNQALAREFRFSREGCAPLSIALADSLPGDAAGHALTVFRANGSVDLLCDFTYDDDEIGRAIDAFSAAYLGNRC